MLGNVDMTLITRFLSFVFVVSLLAMSPNVADAGRHCGPDGCGGGGGGGKPDKGGVDGETNPPPETSTGDPTYSWMHPDVGAAFDLGFNGGGLDLTPDSHMITVDNFSSNILRGSLQDGRRLRKTHGEWTYLQSQLVAPGASHDWISNNTSVGSIADHYDLSNGKLNVVNLSFGLIDPATTPYPFQENEDGSPKLDESGDPIPYTLGNEFWDSIVDGAHAGTAVFVKAPGNLNGGTPDSTFNDLIYGSVKDFLNIELNDAKGAIFVGALDGHAVDGTTSLANYSAIAGDYFDQFVVVGVRDDITSLPGTSFAAPIVTGYAAILGQKFTTATPEQVVDQLIHTAQADNLSEFGVGDDCAAVGTKMNSCDYSFTYGAGEASLSTALAPQSIPSSQ